MNAALPPLPGYGSYSHQYLICKPKCTQHGLLSKKNATAAFYCVVLETTLEPLKRPGVFGLHLPLFCVDSVTKRC